MNKALFVKGRWLNFLCNSVVIAVVFLLSDCSGTGKPDTSDSLDLPVKTDAALKVDSSNSVTDSVLPFEQDTQKIMETLDILDSIRQAKYN
ncbi:MAG: hypothetical protein L6Q81_10675 [Bacteroidia bacterium]|nr:hypothetical protein [Bacteroidia bacterium]